MADQSVYVPLNTLMDFAIEALVKMGVPRADAEFVADVLLAADQYGVRSHGLAHLKMYYQRMKSGLQQPVTRWTIVHETPTTAVIDGGNGMGMVVGHNAMRIAIEKARQNGLGAVAVRNSSHYGIAGYYSRMAAKEGMVGMSFTNAHPSIAPTFGVKPLLGTNPIAFSAPTDETIRVHIRCRHFHRAAGKNRNCGTHGQANSKRVGDQRGWISCHRQHQPAQRNERREGRAASSWRQRRIDGRP